MPVPFTNLRCCYLMYYTPKSAFSPQRGCQKTLKKKQPHKINVSICFALIQPTRKELLHTPLAWIG